MPIETSESGTLITGPEIHFFQHLRIVSGLGLEINTGMKMSRSGSVMKLAAQLCGSTKRTKKAVLSDLVAWMKFTYPTYRTPSSVAKILTTRYLSYHFVQGDDAVPLCDLFDNEGEMALAKRLFAEASEGSHEGDPVTDVHPWSDQDYTYFFERNGTPCEKEPVDGWAVSVRPSLSYCGLVCIETV